MLFKCILVFLALSSVKQADAQLSTLAEWQDKLKQLLEAFNELELNEFLQQVVSSDQLAKILRYFLESYVNNGLPKEAQCVLQVVVNSDEQTQQKVLELVDETIYYIRLVQKRKALEVECESYQGTGLIATAQQQNCLLKLQQVQLQITNSNAKIRLQLTGLSGTVVQVTSCLSSILNN